MISGPSENGNPPISLVVIEDNQLMRQGIVALIESQPDFTVVAAPVSVAAALKKVRQARPRIVLLDCGLVSHDSVQVTATVHAEVPEARIVGMGLLPQQEEVVSLVKAGASGFIMKNAPVSELITTIRVVAEGVDVVPTALALSVLSQATLAASLNGNARAPEAVLLTPRDLQVINLAGGGRSNREIAAQLQIPMHIVRSLMQNLLEKLALRARLENAVSDSPPKPRRGVVLPS